MAAGPRGHDSYREEQALHEVTERLRSQFPEVPATEIDDLVHGRYDQLADSRIRDFVPVLVERGARADLARRKSEHEHEHEHEH